MNTHHVTREYRDKVPDRDRDGEPLWHGPAHRAVCSGCGGDSGWLGIPSHVDEWETWHRSRATVLDEARERDERRWGVKLVIAPV